MAAEEQIAAVTGELMAHSPAAGLTAATAYAYSQLVHPSVKVTGQSLATAWETRLNRWLKIAHDAGGMTPESFRSSAASERVLARSTGETTMFEDAIQQRYASGVIASSRRDTKGDDRGVAFLAMLETMPASYVRLHYALYSSMRDALLAELVSPEDAFKAQWRLPVEVLEEVVGSDGEQNWELREAISVLGAQGLVHLLPAIGSSPAFMPSTLGFSLYTWAHGAAQTGLDLSDEDFPAHHQTGPRFSDSHLRFSRSSASGSFALDL